MSRTKMAIQLGGACLAAFLAAAASPAIAQESQHNGGKAEATGKFLGGVTGAGAGAAAGAAVGGVPGAGAGGAAGQWTGERLGGAAGRHLDQRADENRRTGRGGADDPRYNPFTLFNR